MVDMGAEVGQKMRLAIKAKLTELDCYVDDELPDYIMVMVANKRTKSQMNEDLTLFLNAKTAIFVEWLHIVLKKLKEVTVTNLEVYKTASKRKSIESSDVRVKREKKIKKEKSKKLEETSVKQELEGNSEISLTDNLPLNMKNFSEHRKVMVVSNVSLKKLEDDCNVWNVSDVDHSNMKQLDEIEEQIKTVKDRLGLKSDQDVEESELRKLVNDSRKKIHHDKSVPSKKMHEFLSNGRHIEIDISEIIKLPQGKETPSEIRVIERSELEDDTVAVQEISKKKEHSRITFSMSEFQSSPKKKSALDRLGNYEGLKSRSILERLGSYNADSDTFRESQKKWNNRNEKHKSDSEDQWSSRKSDDFKYARLIERRHDEYEERKNVDGDCQRKKESDFKNQNSPRRRRKQSRSVNNLKKDIKKRLDITSKVTIPPVDPQLLEDTFKKREVVSVVKVKPRILPPNVQQANKNLLLKAVADAQKSIAQTKSVGNNFKEYSMNKHNQETDDSSKAHYSKHYAARRQKLNVKRISSEEKEKLRRFLSNHSFVSHDHLGDKEEQEYIPKPIKRTLSNVEYVPSSIPSVETTEFVEDKRKFIVTLDGIQKSDIIGRTSVKERLHGRKTPSPITFENNKPTAISALPLNIDKREIPKILSSLSHSATRNKEKCKYFPFCKHGERCEYFHPLKNCEQFPYCKFGEKCLYIHPSCKFGTSCTRRDCQYSHATVRTTVLVTPAKQICKFYPLCTNAKCLFYHPNPCKFGNYCKNQSMCNYTHVLPSKSNLTWRSNKI